MARKDKKRSRFGSSKNNLWSLDAEESISFSPSPHPAPITTEARPSVSSPLRAFTISKTEFFSKDGIAGKLLLTPGSKICGFGSASIGSVISLLAIYSFRCCAIFGQRASTIRRLFDKLFSG